MTCTRPSLQDGFGGRGFFSGGFCPISLFCLNVAALGGSFQVALPGLAVHDVCVSCCGRLGSVSGFTGHCIPTFRRFARSQHVRNVFRGCCSRCLKRFPTRMFSGVGRGFVHYSFFRLYSHCLDRYCAFTLRRGRPTKHSSFRVAKVPKARCCGSRQVMRFGCFGTDRTGGMLTLGTPHHRSIRRIGRCTGAVYMRFPCCGVRVCIICITTGGKCGFFRMWACWADVMGVHAL